MSDMMANHVSAAVPGEDGAFLINAYGMLYEEITASSLVKIDVDGNILLKTRLRRARLRHQQGGLRDPRRHPPRAPRRGLRDPHAHLGRHGAFRARVRRASDHADLDAVPEDRLPRLPGRRAGRDAKRSRCCATWAQGEALILRNHGLLTVGKTIGEAFNWMHRLELTARSQLAAMATGAKLVQVPQPCSTTRTCNYQPQTRRPYGVMEWPALLRKLDRMDPGYKD
jgi:ribulose-5-phosphate 4-epimerase/fuculose-1-phosphate aldolase